MEYHIINNDSKAGLPRRNNRIAFTLAEGATHVDKLNNVGKIAFTMAEVLITLGIIGIVAALLLPGIIQNIQDYTFKKQWKKAYSDLSNAAARMADDYQVNTFKEVLEAEAPNFAETGQVFPHTIYAVINKYLNVIKSGLNYDGNWECWSSNGGLIASEESTFQGIGYKYLNGVDSGYWVLGYYPSACFIMTDYIIALDANTSEPGKISVDVNGKKKPNVIGRDVFVVDISNLKKPIPGGAPGFMDMEMYACDKNAEKGGPACSAKYLLD